LNFNNEGVHVMGIKENGKYMLPGGGLFHYEPSEYTCVGYYFKGTEDYQKAMITDFDLNPIGFVSDTYVDHSFPKRDKVVEKIVPKYTIAYKRYESSSWSFSSDVYENIESFHDKFIGDDKPFECYLLGEKK